MNSFEMGPVPEALADSEKVSNLLKALETAKADTEAEIVALGEGNDEKRRELESEIADIEAQIEKSKKFFPEEQDPEDIALDALYSLNAHDDDSEGLESDIGKEDFIA